MPNWTLINNARVREGNLASDDSYGFNGAFRFLVGGYKLKVVASDGEGWKHLSVSLHDFPQKTPSWSMMCQIKDIFFEAEETVVQFHPKKSDYVNHHPGCLHLWRCMDREFPTPPTYMIGPK